MKLLHCRKYCVCLRVFAKHNIIGLNKKSSFWCIWFYTQIELKTKSVDLLSTYEGFPISSYEGEQTSLAYLKGAPLSSFAHIGKGHHHSLFTLVNRCLRAWLSSSHWPVAEKGFQVLLNDPCFSTIWKDHWCGLAW